MSIEEALRTLRDRLATVRLLADLVAQDPTAFHPEAFSGLADICDDMGSLVEAIKKATPFEVLEAEV
jgi:hypothetical protein